MRLFVALEIPRPLRDELERRTVSLRGHLPKARWVRAESMHLTLAFLGRTDPALLPELQTELAATFSSVAPFSLRLEGIGAFPPRGKARVLWVGLTTEDAAAREVLQALRSNVAQAALRVTGAQLDSRPFHPHITLARCSKPWSRGAVQTFQERLAEPPSENFLLRHGTLFESELLPTGARYRKVFTCPMRES